MTKLRTSSRLLAWSLTQFGSPSRLTSPRSFLLLIQFRLTSFEVISAFDTVSLDLTEVISAFDTVSLDLTEVIFTFDTVSKLK